MFEIIMKQRDELPFEVVNWFNVDNKPFDKKLNKLDALEALALVSSAIEKVTPHYSVAHGTALGLHRDKGFISSDIDLDFCIEENHFSDDIIESIQEAGAVLIRHLKFEGRTAGLSFVYKRTKIDLALMMREDDNLLQVTRWRDGALYYCHKPYKTSRFSIEGVETRLPDPIDSYLECEYGLDWILPVTYWHTAFCSNNLYRVEGPDELLIRALRRILQVRQEAFEINGHH